MKDDKVGFDPDVFNSVNPVVGAYFYGDTIEVRRRCLIKGKKDESCGGGNRGKVRRFTKRSRDRLAFTASETDVEFLTMITLTYSPQCPTNGKLVKLHLYKFLRKMRASFGSFDYLWFLEFTRKKTPHFHILLDLIAGDEWDRKIMASHWVDVQGLENYLYCSLRTRRVIALAEAAYEVARHPKSWEILRSEDGGRRYALKYALKIDQKVVPQQYKDVGRLWGTSRPVSRRLGRYVEMDENTLRVLVDRYCPRLSSCDVLPRFIFGVFSSQDEIVSRETIERGDTDEG